MLWLSVSNINSLWSTRPPLNMVFELVLFGDGSLTLVLTYRPTFLL